MIFFSGSSIYTVDSKGRVNIPARYRSQLTRDSSTSDGLVFYVTTGGNMKCLNVFPPEVFESIAKKMEEECGAILSPNENMPTFTKMMADAESCRCDNQGRLIVPKKHLKEAEIDNKVKIVGLGQRIQLWNPDLFEEYVSKKKD